MGAVKPCRANSSSSFGMIPLCMPTTLPCRIGMVVRLDRRVALRVVAHVKKQLRGVSGTLTWASSALAPDAACGLRRAPRVAIGEPYGVGAAFGDPGQQAAGNGGRRNGAPRQAESGNAAHFLVQASVLTVADESDM